jgi:hypothetical protein
MNPKNSEDSRDAFAPENFQMVLLIQMMRTYDILLALLAVDNPQKAMELAEMHEAGLTFTPAPAFALEEDSDK